MRVVDTSVVTVIKENHMRHLFLSVCVLILSNALPVMAAPPAVAPKSTAAPTKPKLAAAPDGTRIVEQRGKFVIRRNTLFCYDRKVDGRIKKVLGDKYIGEGFEGALINDKLDAAAKDKTVPREDRVGPWHDKYLCGHGGDIISILLTTGMNPLGKPYQLELEARQGAGAYVKVVLVRPEGFLRKDVNFDGFTDGMDPGPPKSKERIEKELKSREIAKTATSIRVDASDMSKGLVDYIFSKGVK
jgi:hypothetical protein